MKTLLLDGQNMAHRMRHACDTLLADDGRPTGVLYGSLTSIQKLIDEFHPDSILCAWEHGKSWREDIYPEYKSARRQRGMEESDEEVNAREDFYKIQIPDLLMALGRFGIPVVCVPRLEADDVISLWIHRKRVWDEDNIIIVSTDKDYIQLVRQGKVRVYNPHTQRIWYQDTDRAVYEDGTPHAGSPVEYLWQRTLVGDVSDSIKGIPGVGPKRAAALMAEPPESGEHIIGYFRRVILPQVVDKTTKFAQAVVQDGERIMNTNIDLMVLRGDFLKDSFGGSAELAIRNAYRTSVASMSFGRWQNDRIWREDPNEMLGFFRKRDFQFAHRMNEVRKIVQAFASLSTENIS